MLILHCFFLGLLKNFNFIHYFRVEALEITLLRSTSTSGLRGRGHWLFLRYLGLILTYTVQSYEAYLVEHVEIVQVAFVENKFEKDS